jgi:uncharacterized protein YqeY
MTLFEQVTEDLKKAMLNREKEKLEALRALKTGFLLARSEKGSDYILTNDEELKIVQRLVKQRRDSAVEYSAQNRSDLADKEIVEANVIAAYLPQQLSDEELTVEIKAIISEMGATIKEMGKVIGAASKKLTGKTDGKTISDKVKQLLS